MSEKCSIIWNVYEQLLAVNPSKIVEGFKGVWEEKFKEKLEEYYVTSTIRDEAYEYVTIDTDMPEKNTKIA